MKGGWQKLQNVLVTTCAIEATQFLVTRTRVCGFESSHTVGEVAKICAACEGLGFDGAAMTVQRASTGDITHRL